MELISVDEQLPNELAQVILYNAIGDWFILGCLKDGQFYDEFKRGNRVKATHWAPLPNKPAK